MNAPYFVMLGEYGIIFLIFLFIFHADAFKFKYHEDIIELTLIIGLFIGYPLAYPYFWFVLGFYIIEELKKKMIYIFPPINYE